MPLTDVEVRGAKGRAVPYKKSDGGNLYLLVNPDGGKYWRQDYRFGQKRLTLAHGVYPDVSLAQAREAREAARKLIRMGIDPGEQRKREKLAAQVSRGNTFERVAEEYLEKTAKEGRDEGTVETNRRRLQLYIYPGLGERPVAEITPLELLDVLKQVEARGVYETAKRTKQLCGQIFRHAVASGRATADPTYSLKGALIAPKVKHFAAIVEPKAVGELLRSIDGYQGGLESQGALLLAALTFVRPGELRHAEWPEIDFAQKVWRIPEHKMKLRREHRVPLSVQSIAVFRGLQRINARCRYVFRSNRSDDRPMSENTINAALRRLGYSGDLMTAHGFRAMAATLLNESGLWNADAIERQLAHQEANSVRRAYTHAAEFWNERVRMMQWWADHLDELRGGLRTPGAVF